MTDLFFPKHIDILYKTHNSFGWTFRMYYLLSNMLFLLQFCAEPKL